MLWGNGWGTESEEREEREERKDQSGVTHSSSAVHVHSFSIGTALNRLLDVNRFMVRLHRNVLYTSFVVLEVFYCIQLVRERGWQNSILISDSYSGLSTL